MHLFKNNGVKKNEKIYNLAKKALDCVQIGQTIMVGGCKFVGGSLTLIDPLVELDVMALTIEPGKSLGKLLEQKKVKKAIALISQEIVTQAMPSNMVKSR